MNSKRGVALVVAAEREIAPGIVEALLDAEWAVGVQITDESPDVDLRTPVAVLAPLRADPSEVVREVEAGLGPITAVVDLSLAYDLLFDHEAGARKQPEDIARLVNRQRLLGRRLADNGGGAIVNVGFTGHFASGAGTSELAAVKGALIGATRGLAVELGPKQVRVVSVSPGAILTDAARRRLDQIGGTQRRELEGLLKERIPLRRPGEARDVGDVCTFLVSPEASFITGVDVAVDGGLLCLNRTFSYNPPQFEATPRGHLKTSSRPVAVVTGAARGIGQAIAFAFADAGYGLVINDLEVAEMDATVAGVKERGAEAVAIAADVSDVRQVERLFEEAGRGLGPVEVLVNNAAYYDFGCAMTQTFEAWNRTWGVDVSGIFNTSRAALSHMIQLGRGVIINIASTNAFVTIPQNSAYATAKSGVVAFTRALALELGPHNIRVVDVSPGFTATEAVRLYLEALSDERREEEMGGYYRACPLGRLGEPQEIAAACVFLASDRASYVHGTDVSVDGGMWAVNKVMSYNP